MEYTGNFYHFIRNHFPQVSFISSGPTKIIHIHKVLIPLHTEFITRLCTCTSHSEFRVLNHNIHGMIITSRKGEESNIFLESTVANTSKYHLLTKWCHMGGEVLKRLICKVANLWLVFYSRYCSIASRQVWRLKGVWFCIIIPEKLYKFKKQESPQPFSLSFWG